MEDLPADLIIKIIDLIRPDQFVQCLGEFGKSPQGEVVELIHHLYTGTLPGKSLEQPAGITASP
jgi:hypothetical protein